MRPLLSNISPPHKVTLTHSCRSHGFDVELLTHGHRSPLPPWHHTRQTKLLARPCGPTLFHCTTLHSGDGPRLSTTIQPFLSLCQVLSPDSSFPVQPRPPAPVDRQNIVLEWVMISKSSDKVASPPKAARVEDGKIKKVKPTTKSDPTITAIQHINGKTYACESCKRGHRVHKCDHGKTRPISETNQPGRPSGGQKRGCQCPRNCACTSKTCKCKRDCSCTQDMYVIVRVDGPQLINRDATSTPKPVWEDAEGNQMTLKKVWADANGKQIDEEEYNKRKRKFKEREEGIPPTPEIKSCCATKPTIPTTQPKQEPDSSPSITAPSGCRHRQNLSALPAHDSLMSDHVQQAVKSSTDPWMAACSCGSGCSCLYCPDHPNNATSINHTQQQIKNFAQHAYAGQGFGPNASFIPEAHSTSCMGGRPSFFLSRTPGVSQQQLEQLFSDHLNPNAIYLTYPIQQHSWTSQPMSAHCSQIPSPSAPLAVTPDTGDQFANSEPDLVEILVPWELLPDNSNGTWNFSDSQLGDNGFSWVDFDASRGTDYNVGQATVASNLGPYDFSLEVPQPTNSIPPLTSFDSILQSNMGVDLTTGVPPSSAHLVPQSSFQPFSITGSQIDPQHISLTMAPSQDSLYATQPLDPFPTSRPYQASQPLPIVHSCCGGSNHMGTPSSVNWTGNDVFLNQEIGGDLRSPVSIPKSPPIVNGA